MDDTVGKILRELAGHASVCWKDGAVPTGEFDSEEANRAVEIAIGRLDRIAPMQLQIMTGFYKVAMDRAEAYEATIAELKGVLREVVRISDRKHDAWDAAHKLLGDES